MARLVPLSSGAAQREPGTYAGRIVLSRDFDAPLPDDLLNEFEAGR